MEADSSLGDNAPPLDRPFLALVTGAPDYTDRDTVFWVLDKLHAKHPNITILTGARPAGPERFAQEWAVERERPYIGVPAQWSTRGNTAFEHRNAVMMHYLPNGIVAFPGGDDPDFVQMAADAGVAVWRPV